MRLFFHDRTGQLTTVDSSVTGLDENYAYGETGNRTSGGGAPGVGNRLTEDSQYTDQYDAERNRTRRTVKATEASESYTCDHRNRLVRVEFRTAANVLTQQVAYDAFDNLIRRRVDTNGEAPSMWPQSDDCGNASLCGGVSLAPSPFNVAAVG